MPTFSESIALLVDPCLARPTRIHKLPTAGAAPLFIKREDELSSGIAGSKLRKYASLLPALRERKVTDVALLGGPHSNNLVGLVQLLKEGSMRPWLFCREAADVRLQGNALFLDMLVGEECITRVPKDRWAEAERLAEQELAKRLGDQGTGFVVPEGACCFESLPGAMTLASDLLRNEQENNLYFQRIHVDSGTGTSAAGLLLGLALFDHQAAHREIVVTLIAGDERSFRATLARLRQDLSERLGFAAPPLPSLRFLVPPSAPKFGEVNATVLNACHAIARSEGILMDPVYSVKHYMAMRRDCASLADGRSTLYVHNGSALGLCGFQTQLALSTS